MLGLSVSITNAVPVTCGPDFDLFLTGLSTDSLGTYAQVGNHAVIGYSVGPSPAATSAYAAGGINPELVADFATNTYFSDSATAGAFADLFTFSRASTATYVDSSGTIRTAASGAARTGHHVWNGSAWVNKGLLLESEARTNLLLNSGTLSTQDVTVSAVQYALHFTGSGSITLSGAHSATLNGTGSGEQNRVSLVFTPSAGTLTLTVSGAVENAQLEEVSAEVPYPSSYIPTAGATVTRAAEVLDVAAATMPAYTSALSIAMRGTFTYGDAGINPGFNVSDGNPVFYRWGVDAFNLVGCACSTVGGRTGQIFGAQRVPAGAALSETAGDLYAPGEGLAFAVATRHTAPAVQLAVNGAAQGEAAASGLPDVSTADFNIGSPGFAGNYAGTIERLIVWADDIGTAGIEEVTA